MVTRQDVMTAVLGASAGLAGLALVFLGVLLAALRDLAPTASARVLDRYRRPAVGALASFAACLVTVVLCATWLLLPRAGGCYVAGVVAFFGELALLAGSAAQVTRRVLWE